jgi:hypothetical protein
LHPSPLAEWRHVSLEVAQRSETLTIDVPGVLTLDEATMARDAAGWINLVLARFWRGE